MQPPRTIAERQAQQLEQLEATVERLEARVRALEQRAVRGAGMARVLARWRLAWLLWWRGLRTT